MAEEIPRLSKVPGYNLSCIFSESIKFFYYSQAMNIWNYYPDVQQRYFLEGEHDVHKCNATNNLADCFSDLNPLLILINITAFMSLIGQTDVQHPSQTQELFQITKPTHILPYSNLHTPLKEAARDCCLFPPPFSTRRVVSFTCLSHT